MDSLELNAADDGGTARAGARAATTIVNARMSATAPQNCARTRKAAIMSVSPRSRKPAARDRSVENAHAPDCVNSATRRGKLKAVAARNRGCGVTVKVG